MLLQCSEADKAAEASRIRRILGLDFGPVRRAFRDTLEVRKICFNMAQSLCVVRLSLQSRTKASRLSSNGVVMIK